MEPPSELACSASKAATTGFLFGSKLNVACAIQSVAIEPPSGGASKRPITAFIAHLRDSMALLAHRSGIIQARTWGASTWPPTPPNVRSARGNPGRSSIFSLFRGQRFQGGGEAGEGGAHHARADLAHARAAAGNARVDRRRDRRLDYQSHVDADRAAAVVERLDAEVGVLAGADLAHLGGHGQRLGGAAGAEEARDGGRGGHGGRARGRRLARRALAPVPGRAVGAQGGGGE